MASFPMRQRDPLLDQGTQAMLERRGRELIGLGLVLLAALFSLMLGSYSPDDPGWMVATQEPAQNMLGRFGSAIASTLIILIGRGAWAIPLILLAWGLRFVLHRGSDRVLGRVLFAVFAVAIAATYAATLTKPETWPHSFGLGGLFGETVGAALLNVIPGSLGFGLRLLSFVSFFGMIAILLYVTGFSRSELRVIGQVLSQGAIMLYSMAMQKAGQGAQDAFGRARDMAERRRLSRETLREASQAYQPQADDNAQYAPQPRLQPQPRSPQADPRYLRAAPRPDAGYDAPQPMQSNRTALVHRPAMPAAAAAAVPELPMQNLQQQPQASGYAPSQLAPEPLVATQSWSAPSTLRAEPRRFAPTEPPKEKLGFLARMRQLVEPEPEPELIEPIMPEYMETMLAPGEDRIKARISDVIRSRARNGAMGGVAAAQAGMTPLQAAIAAKRADVATGRVEPPLIRKAVHNALANGLRPRGPVPLIADTRPNTRPPEARAAAQQLEAAQGWSETWDESEDWQEVDALEAWEASRLAAQRATAIGTAEAVAYAPAAQAAAAAVPPQVAAQVVAQAAANLPGTSAEFAAPRLGPAIEPLSDPRFEAASMDPWEVDPNYPPDYIYGDYEPVYEPDAAYFAPSQPLAPQPVMAPAQPVAPRAAVSAAPAMTPPAAAPVAPSGMISRRVEPALSAAGRAAPLHDTPMAHLPAAVAGIAPLAGQVAAQAAVQMAAQALPRVSAPQLGSALGGVVPAAAVLFGAAPSSHNPAAASPAPAIMPPQARGYDEDLYAADEDDWDGAEDLDFDPNPVTPQRPGPVLDRRAVVQQQMAKPIQPSSRAVQEAQPKLKFEEPQIEYELPPLALLSDATGATGQQLSDEALEENARMLESVLDDYGVKGEIVSVRPGPVVTMYELEPAPGLKASRVIGLSDDIARSMSALSARVSTVPGRTVIGIELPNVHREKVFLREIIASREFGDGQQRLPLALGKDIGGASVVANLAKMPHLLIAGTTGSGKSVAINTMILSLLYKLTPEECRLIMIDPKMLELSVYDGIPHLLSPVVTDPKKAVVALKWVVGEMEERYRKMSKMGVRNIEGYNGRVREALAKGEMFKRTIQTGFDEETGDPVFETDEFAPVSLPYIVVIVDEMADLMMVAGKEIEACIQRLAQMARASGIHLIMATQRPSVDVITGTIKANFPTRISFQVTSKIDSRTILGEMGAEQLLGQGDMLYMGNGQRITRIHGPFVSDEEVEEIVNHLKSFGPPTYMSGVVEGPDEDSASDIDQVLGLGGNTDGEDALYDQAVAIVARDRKCSTSYIQRKLGIGYNKAARLVEQMEENHVVTAANHVGKREILIPEV